PVPSGEGGRRPAPSVPARPGLSPLPSAPRFSRPPAPSAPFRGQNQSATEGVMGMIPIGDENIQGGPPPLVNWALIALNVLAFFLELSQPSERALQSFITAW